jgi:hypothetical protein
VQAGSQTVQIRCGFRFGVKCFGISQIIGYLDKPIGKLVRIIGWFLLKAGPFLRVLLYKKRFPHELPYKKLFG